MNLKKFFHDNINPFNDSYTEKDAIRGHAVDRYQYACQLINEDTNEALIKAYAWLNIAAQEIERGKPAKLLMHKIGFELKKRGVFNEALITCQSYYDSFSPEAMRAKIYKSKNPINYLIRVLFCFMTFMDNQVEFFDTRLIKKRGSSFLWGCIAMSSSCILMTAMVYWLKNPSYLSSTFLVSAIIACILSSVLYEDRLYSNNE